MPIKNTLELKQMKAAMRKNMDREGCGCNISKPCACGALIPHTPRLFQIHAGVFRNVSFMEERVVYGVWDEHYPVLGSRQGTDLPYRFPFQYRIDSRSQ